METNDASVAVPAEAGVERAAAGSAEPGWGAVSLGAVFGATSDSFFGAGGMGEGLGAAGALMGAEAGVETGEVGA